MVPALDPNPIQSRLHCTACRQTAARATNEAKNGEKGKEEEGEKGGREKETSVSHSAEKMRERSR